MKTYRSTFTEEIRFSPDNDPWNVHRIDLHSGYDLLVITSPSIPRFHYLFALRNDYEYDLVKQSITETLARCRSIEELTGSLDKVFRRNFADLLVS